MMKSYLIQHRLLSLSLMIVLLFGVNIAANAATYTFTVDGITYGYDDSDPKNAKVYSLSSGYSESDVVIPEIVYYNESPYNVVGIKTYAFSECTNLTSVTLPSSLTSIDYSAFSYCTSLTEITIPSSVKEMGYKVFDGCTSLKKVTFEGSADSGDLELITGSSNPSSIFQNCPLEELYLDRDLKYTGNYSPFRNFESLTKVTFGTNISSISSYAFYYCSGIKSVEIPSNITSIADNAFYKTGLTEIEIPSSIEDMGAYVFYGCTSLTNATVNANLGTYAFSNCTSLTDLTISSNVTTIGRSAFAYCELETMYIFPRLDSYSTVFSVSSCSTVYAHKDEMENVKSASSNKQVQNYYALEDVYTLTVENEYLASIELKVEADEKLLIDDVYIESLTLQSRNSDTSITAILKTEDGLEYIYVATNLVPGTTYICTLTYLYEGEEYTCEVEATTKGVAEGDEITTKEITTSSATFQITINEDPYSLPDRYGLAYITDSNTTIFFANEEGIVTVEGLSEGTQYTLVIFLQYGDTRILTDESITFETKVTVPPTVQTLNAEDITFSSATLKGIVEQGDDEIESKGFEYWVTEDKKEIIPITGDDGDEMSITIEDLTPTTTYTYCVYATTEKGTYVGDTITFTTLYDVESAYNELSKEIEEVTDELSNAWSEITTNYTDVVEDVQEDYDAISNELSEIQQKVKEAYENSTIDDDFVEEIKEELSKISPKIEELLSSAEEAETDYLYSKIKDEIKDALDTLDSAWTTINTVYADIVDDVQEDYDAIFDELSKFTQEVEDAYHSGELNKELVETIESRLEEIDQEIEDLLTKAEEAEIEFLYSKIKDEISEALGTLDSAWTTITTVDEDVAEEFEDNYNAISAELRELTQKVEEAYNNGEFNKDLVETIESSLEEIGQEIKDLLDTAEEAETNYLYGKMTDGITEVSNTLKNAWTTITTDYADVADEFEDDYKAIVSELDELTQKVEDANTNGEITKELVESIESSLEDIKTEIEELLALAQEAAITDLYDKLTKEITDALDTLESAWTTITTVDADVAEEYEDSYKAIVEELDELSQKLEDAHTAGELDKELAESLESELAEITQEIDDLVAIANKAETDYLYNKISDEINDASDTLKNAWTTITTDYADVADEFEDDYKAIADELSELTQKVEDANTNGEITKELVESVGSSLEDIITEIEELLALAQEAAITDLYDKLTKEITDALDTLESAWTTITTVDADVAEEYEDNYKAIVEELDELSKKLEDAHTAGELDKELAESLESELAEITQEIDDLVAIANKAETEYLYNEVSDDVTSSQGALTDAWTTITTDYAEVAEEFEEEYNELVIKLTSLRQELEDAYNADELDKELVETLESSIAEINQEIEELLISVMKAEATYLYDKVSEEVTGSEGTLDDAWTTITTDYADVADEFEEEYNELVIKLTSLRQELEDAYNADELDKELVETLESSIAEINQEIEDLLISVMKAEATYLYNKVSDEVTGSEGTLDDAWTTITTDYADVADEFEEEYNGLMLKLTSLRQELDAAYTAEELDKELVEELESSIEEINQEIEELLEKAKEADIDNFYSKVSDEIVEAKDNLDDVWSTITTDCADVAQEFETDYKVIDTKLGSLSQEMVDIHNDGITRELLESIESRVDEISQEIEALLASATDAETSYLYNKVSDEIKETETSLDDAWTTITTDYADVADEFEDDYKAIVDELSDVAEEFEEAYKAGDLDKELAESIEDSLEKINQEIEDLLAAAKQEHTSGISSIFIDFGDDVQIYNLNGSRVQNAERGKIYIIRYSDGTTRKVFAK